MRERIFLHKGFSAFRTAKPLSVKEDVDVLSVVNIVFDPGFHLPVFENLTILAVWTFRQGRIERHMDFKPGFFLVESLFYLNRFNIVTVY